MSLGLPILANCTLAMFLPVGFVALAGPSDSGYSAAGTGYRDIL
jgi:hypothetical protein